jgi:hypothetical protein
MIVMSGYKDWLGDKLKLMDAKVTFTKKDGTERVMKCTLREDIITPHEKKTDRVKAHNDETLAVWDLDKKEWRSFRYDSIKEVQFGAID